MKTVNYKTTLFAIAALVVIGSLSAAQTVFAQTTLFAYQGKLEFDGAPANGNYDFQFKLFDAAVDGIQQGSTLEQLNITVTNGAYTVNLDFGAAVFSGADRFLEVSVRPAGGSNYSTLTPRQQVTSTPYTIRSLVSTTADGLTAACANCVTSGQIQSVQGAQVTGSVSGSQISGTIPVGSVPAGSGSYIQNTLSQQPGSNFNIAGNGTAAGTLSANIVNATTQYNLAGQRVLSVAGSSNLMVGAGAGLLNSGTDNAFFGRNAGVINTTGSNNSFLGSNTGFKNTTGQDNTFVGNRAGVNNTTAFANTFVGSLAGQANTTGYYNSFLGKEAGSSNTTGGFNSFFGAGAGFSNTTGYQNAFFGTSAGYSNTTGRDNAFFGLFAGHNSTTGEANSFFGSQAGDANTTGGSNSFFGAFAGLNNTTGGSNVFVGGGSSNTTGSQNAFFGAAAGAYNTTGSNNTFIGYFAGSDTQNPIGNNNTLLGYNSKVNSGVSNSTAIGTLAQVTTSNTIVLGTDQETVIVPGKLQVDTLGTIGHDKVCLNNNNRLAACSSSLRYKTNLQPFAAGMSIINRLEPISYTWKDGGQRDVGFGAEDVHKIEPLLVTYNAEGLVEGVKYDRITVALVNAIKEQQMQIAAQQRQISEFSHLQSENARLKAQLADILARLEQLEKTSGNRK
ncbi:MAG TPA: tail fiber domain-containing protein [Blastocatellia bacterium]|nr:tail fiber domain-containing protein [Blastocatellia bacterium]